MSYTLKWTPRADSTFKKNVDYLLKQWTTQVLHQFLERVSEVLGVIQNNPRLYPIHDSLKEIRKCVVHERIVLYYRITGNTVELLIFWNTYRNPRNLRL